MHIPVVVEVMPFLIGALVVFGGAGAVCRWLNWRRAAAVSYLLALVAAGYLLYFFRDPERHPPNEPAFVLAGADGEVMSVTNVREDIYLHTNTVRISIFLSLFDVHVNRAPIGGVATYLGYVPGKHYFTFQEKSSEFNQHNSILFSNAYTRCLMYQIVGPVARRVVYWKPDVTEVAPGERIGMMKFGSRLDMYLPQADVTVKVKQGDRVTAGMSVVAEIKALKDAVPKAAAAARAPPVQERAL